MSGASKASSKHKHVQLERGIDEPLEIRPGQHADDGEHTARSGNAALEHLVRVDEEILAHGRNAQRRQCARAGSEVIERAVEAAGLGENRYRGGAGIRVAGDTRADTLFSCRLEQTHGR